MSNHEQAEYIKLIQKHNGIIHKVIGLYVNNQEDKRDLHQEVLLQAWKSYKNFKGQSVFSTWLYKVALNTVLTFNKKRTLNEDIDKTVPTEPVQEDKEDYEVLYDIIKSLGEIDRMLISLHLDGYRNNEIAEITGMTPNHINVKIHRIKGNIIEKFKLINNG
nr:sigma-70 family RNA polymerase sigma factor [Bacteroidota bacterium]